MSLSLFPFFVALFPQKYGIFMEFWFLRFLGVPVGQVREPWRVGKKIQNMKTLIMEIILLKCAWVYGKM